MNELLMCDEYGDDYLMQWPCNICKLITSSYIDSDAKQGPPQQINHHWNKPK